MTGLRGAVAQRRDVASAAFVAGLVSCLALLVLPARVGRAEPPGAGLFSVGGRDGETVTVDADSVTYDRAADTLRASGDVVVTVGGSVLAADQIDIDRTTSKADAAGSVVLEDPQGRIRAESASFLLEDETGYLEEGEVYLPQSRFQITGARLEKGIGQTYRIWDGTFTTCQCEDGAPDWSIEGEQIDVELGGWGKLRSGRFKIKDQPILYLPYGMFPILRDRQTGFLFPNVGYETGRGFQYVQPFFWAIDKSSDLTLKLDVETQARIGMVAEYRYLWSEKAGGNLGGSYFNEAIRTSKPSDFVDNTEDLADPHVSQNRWDVTGYHQQVGPGGSRIYVQPFYVSDNLFLREMNVLTDLPYENIKLSTLRYTRSRAGISKVWDWGFAQADAAWKQDLIQKQSRVPQSLPRLTFQARKSLFDSQLLLRLSTEAVEYYRAPLDSGPRFDLAPQALVPFRLGQYAYGDATLTLHETVYYLFDNDQPVYPDNITQDNVNDPLPTRIVPHFQHREILEGKVNLRSEVSRIFEVDDWGDIKKLKRTIEPSLQYNYIPVVGQDDLPLWDGIDRIRARNTVTYGVSTRLLAKVRGGALALLADGVPPGETLTNPVTGDQSYGPPTQATVSGDSPEAIADERIQELGRAWLRQSYEISQPIKPGQHLSGVEVGLRVTPVRFFGAQGRLIYSVENPAKLSYATAGVNLYDPRPVAGPDDVFLPELRPANSISLFYQFTGDQFGISGGGVENINLAATYRVTNNFALSYLSRFDALDRSFLENWAGLRVISSCDCWVVDLAFVDRSNPDTTGVRVQVSLVGLGTFGQQPGAGFGGFPRVVDTTGVGRSY